MNGQKKEVQLCVECGVWMEYGKREKSQDKCMQFNEKKIRKKERKRTLYNRYVYIYNNNMEIDKSPCEGTIHVER